MKKIDKLTFWFILFLSLSIIFGMVAIVGMFQILSNINVWYYWVIWIVASLLTATCSITSNKINDKINENLSTGFIEEWFKKNGEKMEKEIEKVLYKTKKEINQLNELQTKVGNRPKEQSKVAKSKRNTNR